jgi:glucoamylase
VESVSADRGELAIWIAAQARRSVVAMERAISATSVARVRDTFAQTIIPARGSVLASPSVADWNPEPDYFFHWVRDSAIVMSVVADLAAHASDPRERARWTRHFEDFIAFSLRLTELEGTAALAVLRDARIRPEARKFLREDSELRALAGNAVLGEPRFNPDGTLDIFRWSRPQFDGPALRALACLQFFRAGRHESGALTSLLQRDLEFTLRHAGERCIGPWEEEGENAHHYHVGVVQLGALVHGRGWIDEPLRVAAETRLRAQLDRHWSSRHEVYVAILPLTSDARDDLIDTACLLAVLDADLPDGPHSIADEKVWSTVAALERLFADIFPINAGRAAPALGRSRADRYFGGGAWYPTTLAAASLCYRRALREPASRAQMLARGDAYMRTVWDLTPPDGTFSEQVDRTSGAPASARDLAWSYAAFVSAARLRNKAVRA